MHWHYTYGLHIGEILADRKIRFAFGDKGQTPTAWLSTNPEWEATVFKTIPTTEGRKEMSKAELAAIFGLFRIRVSDNLPVVGWHEYRSTAYKNSPPSINGRGLEKMAYARNAKPSEWRCSFVEIDAEHWESVEVLRAGSWCPLTAEEYAELEADGKEKSVVERFNARAEAFNARHGLQSLSYEAAEGLRIAT